MTENDPVEALRELVEAADRAAHACNTGMMDEAIAKARSALAAAESAGMVMVPKVPTEAVLRTLAIVIQERAHGYGDLSDIYRAMIEAASQQEKP